MNNTIGRASSTSRLAFLLGTASAAVLGITSANAQVAEVLITGSLISGTPAVGVPVTNLGQQDFIEAGAVNVLELLETLPSLDIPPTNSPAFGAGTLHFANNVQIHGLGVGDTLMMQDGRRWPLQGYDGERVDPAIFPQLAIARVDVLTAGASATYGADATAGVLNIILKRDIDGAETFLRFGAAPGAGNENVTFAQLYGTSWDTGNVTMTWEITHQREVEAADLPFLTWNFSENGGFPGFDYTDISASNPGFISKGRLDKGTQGINPYNGEKYPGVFRDRQGGVGCINCFSLPNGIGWDFGTNAPGPTVDYSQISTGFNAENIRNPWIEGWARPAMESTAFVGTMHQRLTPNLDLFGVDWGPVRFIFDGMWSNRRFKQEYPGDSGQSRENMSKRGRGYDFDKNDPTPNPYLPTNLPANMDPQQGGDLNIHWSIGPELDTPIISGGQQNARWLFGFEFDDLPFNWHGRMDYSNTDNTSYGYDRGGLIRNMVSAALGNEVEIEDPFPGVGGSVFFEKPDSIPFLNPFCDGTVHQCNSPQTIAYIQGRRDQLLRSHFSELNVQFDGPIFELPAGPVVVALAYNHLVKNQQFRQENNTNSDHRDQIIIGGDNLSELSNSLIFQANLPIFGTGFNFPLFEAFDVELGYRVDEYDNLAEKVWTPKVGANWTVGWGLTFRGSWGKSFRTPKGEEISLTGVGITALNDQGGIESNNTNPLFSEKGCPNGAGGAPLAGTLIALANPTCDASLINALGIAVSGNPVGTEAAIAKSGLYPGGSPTLGPQNAKQFNLGFNFTPGPEHFRGLLTGLTVDVTWWNLKYRDLIDGIFQGTGPDDVLSTPFYIPITNPNASFFDPSNAVFRTLVEDLVATPTRVSRRPANDILELTKFIQISTTGNIGEAEHEGIEFNVRYDWDIGNWGSFHVGAVGDYRLKARLRAAEGSPWVEPLFGVPDHTQTIGNSTYIGTNARGNQLEEVRYRMGWTDGTWNFTSFFNYRGHGQQDEYGSLVLPSCFYARSAAASACYPGSPHYGPFANDIYPIVSPATVLVDITFGYNTGDMPTNPYLRNIQVQFGVTNLLDKTPPLGVRPLRSRGTGVSAYDRTYSDLQREVSMTITKQW
jgi:outer membrane receptor protein involved in Fe transport